MSTHANPSRAAIAALSLIGATVVPSLATAQDIAVANRNANQFEAGAGRVEATDEHRLRAQVGAAVIEGNSRSLTTNAAVRYQLRRGAWELTSEGIVNLGFAVNPMMTAAGYQRNVENYLVRARGDRYFGDNSLWISPLFFRDTFAGFAARVSGQAGYLRNFYNDPGRRKFKGEFGIDATYEALQFGAMVPARCPDGTMAAPMGSTAECGSFAFMGRVYLGYEDNSSSMFSFNAGLETLVNFLGLARQVPGMIGVNAPPDIRVNFNAAFSVKVSDFFSVGAQYALRLLVQPIGNNRADDHNVLLTLNFSHSFDAPPPPAAPAAPPCPTCPTCPEPATAPTPAATETAPAADAPPAAAGATAPTAAGTATTPAATTPAAGGATPPR
jgi:hypothetical protein